jgi:hypothetical protein
MTTTNPLVDERGQRVINFQSQAHNLSRLALLRDLIADMFESGDWRAYRTALGQQRWRACEFDYFLIASDIAYTDAQKVLTFGRRNVELATATRSDDPKLRRSLEQASKEWLSGTPETLEMRAERLGWMHSRGLRPSPVPARARSYAKHGVSRDTHATKTRQQLLKDCRQQLDKLVDDIMRRASDETKLRYVLDRLRERLARSRKHGKDGRPSTDHQQWSRDIKTFKGDGKALAKHWNVTQQVVSWRKKQVKSRHNLLSRQAS